MNKFYRKFYLYQEVVNLEFEPKILAFLCNWCSYAGADLAGVSRMQYPPNIRVIRIMCSGRVDPKFVIQALKNKMDGVLIMGCHLGDCHYLSGNYEAEMKYHLLKKLLKLINMADRIQLEWVSAAEGIRFQKIVTEFTEKIKKIGPTPLKESKNNPDMMLNIDAIQRTVEEFRLRALVGRKRKIIDEGNVYDNRISEDKFEEIQNNAIFDEYTRQKILILLDKSERSVKSLAEQLDEDTSKILEHIVILRNQGLVILSKVEEITPFYASMEVH
ncbi:MAG: hydrogenase iron-sulfur subunit [Candidatus Lokiarchaeota archaeon]|nr:hydrogenase iron-sulfur subunit [Candidatus Lokiarchaeota archaeon]